MAVVQNLLIGRSRGRVGNVVFSTHKGQNILKAKAEIVANPRSVLQQANRARFVALMAIGRMLRPILALGFKEYAGSVTWLNKFMSTNSYSDLMIWDDTTSSWLTQLENVVVAEGQLLPTPFLDVASSATTLNVNWETSPLANQSAEDLLIIVVMCKSDTQYQIKEVARSSGAADIAFLGGTVGDTVYYAGFFISPNGTIVSNSYAGSVTITA